MSGGVLGLLLLGGAWAQEDAGAEDHDVEDHEATDHEATDHEATEHEATEHEATEHGTAEHGHGEVAHEHGEHGHSGLHSPHEIVHHEREPYLRHIEHQRHLPIWASPERQRRSLIAGGGLALAAGTIWFLRLGDNLGAGDPASLLMGSGLVAVMGATTGALLVDYRGEERRLYDAPGRPLVSLDLSPRSSSVLGEADPSALWLTVSPTLSLGSDCAQLVPTIRGGSDLGWEQHLDPRPQVTGSDAAGDLVLQSRRLGVDAALDWRLYPGCFGKLWPVQQHRLQWLAETRVQSRWERYDFGPSNTARDLRRTALMPLNLGARWHLSGRQRFTVRLGPRWDRLAWSSPAGFDSLFDPNVADGQGFVFGPLHGAFSYDLYDRWEHWQPLNREVVQHLRLTYEHSNFDGAGWNQAAVIGFFGPFVVEYDLSWARPGARWQTELGVDVAIGEDVGVVLVLGLRPGENR